MNIFNKFFREERKEDIQLKDVEYLIEKQKVILPANHLLPRFQKENKLYDRFLPILSKCLPEEKIIVDIGANVGDTLISMIQHSDNNFFCVEPSEEFYEYLNKNISTLDTNKQSQIKVFKYLIGTNKFSGKIIENGLGTASLKITDSNTAPNNIISLDDLLQNQNNVILIKVDTDGFDFDVLLSGKTSCLNEKPILYWENEVKTEIQKNGFYELYEFLESIGYNHIFIFDNFGNLMIENTDFKTLSHLTEYVYSMNNHNCTRTIYYNDILATCSNNIDIVNNAICEYKKIIIS